MSLFRRAGYRARFDYNLGAYVEGDEPAMRRRLPPLRWLIAAWLYPTFDCESCNGVSGFEGVGCECSYKGAIAPGVGPGRLRAWLRRRLDPYIGYPPGEEP